MDKEKLLYLLNYMEYPIDLLVDNVINDSEEDPEYSAVTATNLIKSYIQVTKELEVFKPYKSVKEYILNDGYTFEEYELYEKKRKNESANYIGIQF